MTRISIGLLFVGYKLISLFLEPFLNLILKNFLCYRWWLSFALVGILSQNHQSDEDGRILIIWKDPMKVRVVHQSSQSLTCLLELPNKDPFYYTAVYASNLCANRADLWAELIYLSDFYDLQNNQWFVGGDFNQILQPSEHSSPTVSVPNSLMYQFQDCILQAGLFDLRYNGPSLTWTNNQPDSPIAKKTG